MFDTRLAPAKVETEAIATVIGLYERLETVRYRAPNATVDFADADAEGMAQFFRRMSPPPTGE
ncbi:MAG: hypothetical protein EBS05_22345 [Proteobacteria bacterium]|nr:hypothetical protein [Pseudomonadota bacterium]